MGLLGGDDSDKTGGFAKGDKLENSQRAERVVDEEAGVVIYKAFFSIHGVEDGFGMTAVPIEDTNLTLDNEPE